MTILVEHVSLHPEQWNFWKSKPDVATQANGQPCQDKERYGYASDLSAPIWHVWYVGRCEFG
jgi:hypothetical protein